MAIKKYDQENYCRFPPNFGQACKTILHASIPNLKSFGPLKQSNGPKK